MKLETLKDRSLELYIYHIYKMLNCNLYYIQCMLQFSDKEKQSLLYLITNCEIYQLNEKEALEYIKNKFSKPISRRTYYNYKSQVYEEHDKNSPYSGLFRFQESKQRSKDITSLSLISHRERIIQDRLLNGNITSRNEFSRLDDPEISLKKMREKAIFLIKVKKY